MTGIFDVSDELFLSEISRPMLPETLGSTRPSTRQLERRLRQSDLEHETHSLVSAGHGLNNGVPCIQIVEWAVEQHNNAPRHREELGERVSMLKSLTFSVLSM